MEYCIGVDGGGTGCRVAIAEIDGTVLGRAEGGAANIATNFETARSNILHTISLAFVNAGVAKPDTAKTTVVLGLAGANLGDFKQRLELRLPYTKSHIVSDGETTLVGAIGEEDGIIGAIGTGSVYGRREHGEFTQLGGWGFLLGDDGSGARIGRDMLNLAIKAFDGIEPHSPLTLEIIKEYQGSPIHIVEKAKAFAPRDFGQLAPRIVEAAKLGDVNAEAILAQHTETVRKSLDAIGFDPSKAFCMLGGLGNVFLKRLPTHYQDAARTPLGNALDGAVSLAISLSRST